MRNINREQMYKLFGDRKNGSNARDDNKVKTLYNSNSDGQPLGSKLRSLQGSNNAITSYYPADSSGKEVARSNSDSNVSSLPGSTSNPGSYSANLSSYGAGQSGRVDSDDNLLAQSVKSSHLGPDWSSWAAGPASTAQVSTGNGRMSVSPDGVVTGADGNFSYNKDLGSNSGDMQNYKDQIEMNRLRDLLSTTNGQMDGNSVSGYTTDSPSGVVSKDDYNNAIKQSFDGYMSATPKDQISQDSYNDYLASNFNKNLPQSEKPKIGDTTYDSLSDFEKAKKDNAYSKFDNEYNLPKIKARLDNTKENAEIGKLNAESNKLNSDAQSKQPVAEGSPSSTWSGWTVSDPNVNSLFNKDSRLKKEITLRNDAASDAANSIDELMTTAKGYSALDPNSQSLKREELRRVAAEARSKYKSYLPPADLKTLDSIIVNPANSILSMEHDTSELARLQSRILGDRDKDAHEYTGQSTNYTFKLPKPFKNPKTGQYETEVIIDSKHSKESFDELKKMGAL